MIGFTARLAVRATLLAVTVGVPGAAQGYLDFASSAVAKQQTREMVKRGAAIRGRIGAVDDAIEQAERRVNELNWRGPDTARIDAATQELEARRFDSTEFDAKLSDLRAARWMQNAEQRQRIHAARAAGPDTSSIDRQVSRLRADISELEAVKRRSLRELRDGLYCSKCNRPKSQIELETRQTFRQHLREVRGRARPASNAQIKRKRDEFDAKIARLQARVKSQEQRKEPLRRKHADKLTRLDATADQKDRAFAERIRAFEQRRSDYQKRFKENVRKRLEQLAADRERIRHKHREAVNGASRELADLRARRRTLKRQYNDTENAYRRAHWQMRQLENTERDAAEAALREQRHTAEREARRAAREARLAEAKARGIARQRYRARQKPHRQATAVTAASSPTRREPGPARIRDLKREQRAAEQRLEGLRKRQAKALAAWEASERSLAAEQAARAVADARARRRQLAANDGTRTSAFATVPDAATGLAALSSARRQTRERMMASLARLGPDAPSPTANADGKGAVRRALDRLVDSLPESGQRLRQRVTFKTRALRDSVVEVWRDGRDAFRQSYREDVAGTPKRIWGAFQSSKQDHLATRLTDSVRGAIHRLTPAGQLEQAARRLDPKEQAKRWKRKVTGYLRERSITSIASNNYERRTGAVWSEASGLEQNTETLFTEARFIAPPKEYLDRLMQAFARTTSRWDEAFLGDLKEDEDLIR
ncbi:MAG: hypothetical protein AAF458_12085 [Pseudomonadota bacterium]